MAGAAAGIDGGDESDGPEPTAAPSKPAPSGYALIFEDDYDDSDDDDNDDLPGSRVLSRVNLAKTMCEYLLFAHRHVLLADHMMIVSRGTADVVAARIERPDLPLLIQKFLHGQLRKPAAADSESDSSSESDISQSALPQFHGKIALYAGAVAIFYAPSDLSGVGGMRRERIHALPSWRGGPARYDTVLVSTDNRVDGMLGHDIARARLFFSFTYRGRLYPCVLVDWCSRVGTAADADTGMWIVQPDRDADGKPNNSAVIHLGSLVRCAHLIGVYGPQTVHRQMTFSDSLDAFRSYYVNKYADHHMYETVF